MPKTRRSWLEGLNPEQYRAVKTTDGPLLVLAGAGTGKTRVITSRIAQLLHERVPARNILAMTFTNKAANEMRERVAKLVGKETAKHLTIGTFHSFCVRILRAHAEQLELPKSFSICDASDQLAAVKAAMRELTIPEATIHPNAALGRISLHKSRIESPARALELATDDFEEIVARIYKRYDEHLRRAAALDFDDLLLFTLKLFDDVPGARQALAERFRYILVDEYQDTNAPQYEIVRALAEPERNVCVVGDDDQSIYGWRGADVKKILRFEQDFPGAAVVRLETNYRSTAEILDAANRVIRYNTARHDKALNSALGGGEKLTVVETADEEDEADFVVRDLLTQVREGHAGLDDFAILFRTAVQPRAYEARLRAEEVPYTLVGGQSFFDRKEVRDVLAFLKVVANPDDEIALLRVINTPPRGVGKSSIERVQAFAAEKRISVGQAFDRIDEVPKAPPAAVRGVGDLRSVLRNLGARVGSVPLPDLVSDLLDGVNYRVEVDRVYPEPLTRDARWAAVTEIVNFAENYARRVRRPTLTGFLEELTLQATDDGKDEKDKRSGVTLMTLHAAKGLEFPSVYFVGMEENLLPHHKCQEDEQVEEERRLAYVGITRAMRKLTITRANSRARFGTRAASKPSRFLLELLGVDAEGEAIAEPLDVVAKQTLKARDPDAVPRKKAPARRGRSRAWRR